MATMPPQYYDRSDPAKEYDEHLFIAGRGLQSAELNEIQKKSASRIKSVADVLFKDGDIVSDASIIVDEGTGVTQCQSGAIYLRGAVRGVAPATFTIPMGEVAIGIRLVDTVVTSTEDPTLLDPATGTRNYNQPGAERLKTHPKWGWAGDGESGEFFPVYSAVDRIVGAKEVPPNLDAVTQALARYDRDSAGGMYVVNGLNVTKLDDVGGNQVYSMAEGRARVFGFGVEFPTSRRLVLSADADLKQITNEPHMSSTIGAQRVNFDRTPGTDITAVSITAEKTVTLTHGVFTGAQDPLPDTSVLLILEVKQGATTYTATTDYLLTAGKVDWTPGGAEPSPGSTYTVKYRYITLVTPTSVDDNGFTVTGAVSGTLVLVTYKQKLPRIDRLCLNADGETIWLIGVAAEYNPQPPSMPGDLLPLASVFQTWTADRTVRNDGVRVVPMPALAAIEGKFDTVLQLIAQQRLESNIHTRESGTKKGLFTDPFLDDSQRDAGTVQTAAIVNGELLLPIAATINKVDADVIVPTTLIYTSIAGLEQPLRTGGMKINPYMAYAPVPATLVLDPAVDRWTEVVTDWESPTTARFVSGQGNASTITTSVRNLHVNTTTTAIERLRQIVVHFKASGFGPGENVSHMYFDGVEVTPTAP